MSDNLPERYFGHAEIDLMARHAKAFAISGLFEDIRGEVQAYVKIAAGAEVGLLPFEAMNAIDIIKGKCVFNAGFLASKVKGNPRYDFRVIEISNDRVEILFREKVDLPEGGWQWESLGSSVFTMDDAKQAGLLGRGDMYTKFSRNMLQSRAMSNGVAWFCPDVLHTRVYEMGEIPAPAERPEQEGGEAATVPEREPENVIDVTPEPAENLRHELEVSAQALADAQQARDQEALAEREAIAAAQREAAKAPEQVAHEAQQASDMADAMHSEREAEVAAQETVEKAYDAIRGEEPPFGGDQPLPPPSPFDVTYDPSASVPDEIETVVVQRPATDEDKVAAIGRLFNPNDPTALPTDIRLKVKKACEILEIWDKNTPTALFLLFGDAAMTSKGLQEGLAKALDEQKARKDAEKAAAPETAVQEPETGLSSVASALKAQDAKIQQVLGVLNGLTSDQAAALSDALDAQGQPSGATPETMAKELWLGYGPAALSADTLLAALDQPPWASDDGQTLAGEGS